MSTTSNLRGPKVVLVGAGSAFFGRQTIWSMVRKAALNNGCLAMAETNPTKLDWLHKIAKRAVEAEDVSLRIEVSNDYQELLHDADFVILAFAVEGVKLRGIDAEVSTRHGMVMCSADTIGPGGIMRTLREVPLQTEILNEVRRRCPNAWVINWVNPTSAMGIAMMRHFPDIRSLAICDGPHNPWFNDRLIVEAGLAQSIDQITDSLRSKVLIRSGGVNHFNWLVEMKIGKTDLTPRIMERLRNASQEQHVAASEDTKVALANQISWKLANAIGYAPMCVWHTQEYLPFFQGHDINKEGAIAIKQWRLDVRERWMQECWDDMAAIATGKRQIAEFLSQTGADHACDIIEAMWAGLPKRFYLNVPNNGAVTNMPADAYLELECVVDMNSARPLPFGEMPRPLVGYMHRVLDEHELAVQAATSFDMRTLRQAFLASMVATSLPDVEACMKELLTLEKDFLPSQWQTSLQAVNLSSTL